MELHALLFLQHYEINTRENQNEKEEIKINAELYRSNTSNTMLQSN